MNETSRIYSSAAPNESLALRAGPPAAVRAALLAARQRTLCLADDFQAALGTAYPGVPYAAELNPPLWELGHIAWFQEWWIARNRQRALGVACDPAHAREPSLLPLADTWYDSSRVAHRTRWELPLPGAEATRDYLQRTLSQTLELLDRLPPHANDELLYFFRLVTLHEEMHAEAATYMAETLGISVRAKEQAQNQSATAELKLPGQRFHMGSGDTGFAFDNELRDHEVTLQPRGHRCSAGHLGALPALCRSRRLRAASVVVGRRAGMAGSPACAPAGRVRLAATRLAAAARRPLAAARSAARSGSPHRARGAGLVPLGRTATADRGRMGMRGLTLPGFCWGQVWEWTASAFEPYAGFAPHPYRDYSAPWFSSRRVLRGACHATSAALAHARYRNFFEPHRNDIFAGFRSAIST